MSRRSLQAQRAMQRLRGALSGVPVEGGGRQRAAAEEYAVQRVAARIGPLSSGDMAILREMASVARRQVAAAQSIEAGRTGNPNRTIPVSEGYTPSGNNRYRYTVLVETVRADGSGTDTVVVWVESPVPLTAQQIRQEAAAAVNTARVTPEYSNRVQGIRPVGEANARVIAAERAF